MRTSAFTLTLFVLSGVACERSNAAGPAPAPSAATATSGSAAGRDGKDVLADVGGEPITRAEVETRAAGALQGIRQQEFDILSNVLRDMVSEKLLAAEAKKRGVSVDDLLQKEVEARAPAPAPNEVDAFYEANKQRMGGRTLDDARPLIARYLTDQKREGARSDLLASLRKTSKVKIALNPPRLDVPIPMDAPSRRRRIPPSPCRRCHTRRPARVR